ncbi:hypothetical protein PR048_001815, partial [Dryococelus australis]
MGLMLVADVNQYMIQFKKGKNFHNADCLFCLPNNCLLALPDDYYDCNFIYMQTKVSYKEVSDITSKYIILKCCLRNRVVIPGQLKNKVLSIIHADHEGITRCKLMTISYIWWFGINDDIEMKTCWIPTHKTKFLIAVDDYTKWIECFILNNTNLDRGIKLIKIAPYNPWSNGLAERELQTFNKPLIKICLFSLRPTPSSVTGVSPMSLMLNYQSKNIMSMSNP